MVRTCMLTLILFTLFTTNALGADAQPSNAPSQPNTPTTTQQSPQLTPQEQKAREDLKAIKQRPKDYRVLIMGIQIFLGRFGYGVGPYTGTFDAQTKSALKKYQRHNSLPVTGDLDYRTLMNLTDDNIILDRPLPYLPQYAFHGEQWDKAIQVQGTWARDSGPTSDAIQTSKIYCFREQKQCIESTAVLLVEKAPILEVMTHMYTIKEWNDEQLVSEPYDGESCTISILRINRQNHVVTRFTAYQQGEGICAKVNTEDVQFRLTKGPGVFVSLQQRKAQETQQIFQVIE